MMKTKNSSKNDVMSTHAAGDAAIDYGSLFQINPEYLKSEFGENVRSTLAGSGSDSLPFPHISMDDFLTDTKALELLRSELSRAKWKPKETDLYTMKRTVELINFDITIFPVLKAFRKFLATQCREFMMNLTGVQLNERVDVAGSSYSECDVLLPHDDRMEERKFAFIFYLTPEWESDWGGALNLFNADDQHYPTTVAKKIVPKYNNFLFFDINHGIGHTSWHCVEEVVKSGKNRLSLNGWYHIDDIGKSRSLPSEIAIEKLTPTLDIDYKDVRAWINPHYIASCEQKSIKKLFATRSELVLHNFLTEEKYAEALAELKTAHFDATGPPNLRFVERLNESKLPEKSAIKDLFKLMRSEAMTLLISQWTGLHLYDLKSISNSDAPPEKKRKTDEESDGKKDVKIVSFINKMSHGCYSLCDDQMAADALNNGFCFDLLIFFMETDEWNKDAGGYLSYIAQNDPNEILRVDAMKNAAAFVFREPEVLSFTKYINSKAGEDQYYILNCSYFSKSSGDSDSESSNEEDNEFNDEDTEELGSEPPIEDVSEIDGENGECDEDEDIEETDETRDSTISETNKH